MLGVVVTVVETAQWSVAVVTVFETASWSVVVAMTVVGTGQQSVVLTIIGTDSWSVLMHCLCYGSCCSVFVVVGTNQWYIIFDGAVVGATDTAGFVVEVSVFR